MQHLDSEVAGAWLPEMQPASVQVLALEVLSRYRGGALVQSLQKRALVLGWASSAVVFRVLRHQQGPRPIPCNLDRNFRRFRVSQAWPR